jgi:hypothetical protein
MFRGIYNCCAFKKFTQIKITQVTDKAIFFIQFIILFKAIKVMNGNLKEEKSLMNGLIFSVTVNKQIMQIPIS